MSLYEKIGRLIKQNKLYEIYNSNSSDDSNIENIINDLLFSNKMESPSISTHILGEKKIISINELKEIQNLIKNCTKEEQLILIAILELQLLGNENHYIKYEKINEKIIEKNIYWVITKEIHKNIHKEKVDNEFEEYCHCIHDQKEKYILGTEYNFKYENIDSIICKLKNTNKNIEFIAIKTIFISLYNISCEYIQKYIEINEFIKKNNYYEYLVFDYIINDFIYINTKLNFIEIDFKQSLNNFKKEYNIIFSIEELFKDIFFNAIFHNHSLGCLYIHGFIRNNNNSKSSLTKILNIITKQNLPLYKNISKILNIEKLFNFKMDLTTKFLEKIEQLHICVGIGSIEREINVKTENEKNSEIWNKKEIIYVSGSLEKNDNDKINLISNISKINMEKIFLDIDKNDIESIPILHEKNNLYNKEDKLGNNSENEKENVSNENMKGKNNINDSNKNKKDNIDKLNMENKSLDEIYEYINKDSKTKNKKKYKKRNGKNKGKTKKNNKGEEDKIDTDINNIIEDPIVIQFKNDINEKVIYANNITKIKPFISEKWIKTISV